MDVEVLVIPQCPGADEATRLLRTALDDIGLAETRFTVTVIDADEKAQTRQFAGSPAFLVNGVDLFANNNGDGSMACRIYSTPDGPQNLPALRDLRRALKEHAARTTTVGSRASPSSRPKSNNPERPPEQCWCCGSVDDPDRMVHLGDHPEVGLCRPCARWAAKQAWEIEDRDRTGVLVSMRDQFRHLRRGAIHRNWHRHPLFGPLLRWLRRHVP